MQRYSLLSEKGMSWEGLDCYLERKAQITKSGGTFEEIFLLFEKRMSWVGWLLGARCADHEGFSNAGLTHSDQGSARSKRTECSKAVIFEGLRGRARQGHLTPHSARRSESVLAADSTPLLMPLPNRRGGAGRARSGGLVKAF
mmetsp:Transcript_76651/g.206518  ORF Transcript_76651/g.206518 Transcript_76651/m.206518 type:complete len:143 (-) Transcript_76651:713-1141(-)